MAAPSQAFSQAEKGSLTNHKMLVNDKELVNIALKKPATMEGILKYKVYTDDFKPVSQQCWFKLINNLLFYFGLNYFGGIRANEPLGVFVLENCVISFSKEEDRNNTSAFSIIFSWNQERHVFSCLNLNQAQCWVIALRQASYEHLKIQAKILQDKIASFGGKTASNTSSSGASIRQLKHATTAALPALHPDSQRNLKFRTRLYSADVDCWQLPEFESKPSSLLSITENGILFKLIGLRSDSMASAVVQVYFADPQSRSRWKKRHCGVLCFVKDNIKRSYYLRVFCLDRQSVVWQQELYSSFEYCAPRLYFHTFEGDNCRVGLNFANDAEAEFFLMAMKEYMRIKSGKRERRRLSQQQSQPSVKPTPVATNGSASKTTVRTTATTNIVTAKKSKKDKNKKITKADIGLPSDFKHLSHVGWDPNQGFALDNVDPNLLKFFARAGISESHLKDKATREFIYDFIDKHGGKEAAIREISSMQQNTGLFSAPPVPDKYPPSTSHLAKMAPPSRPTTAPSPTHFKTIASSLSIVPLPPPQLVASSKMAPVTIAPPSSPASPPPPPPLPPTLDKPSPPVRPFTLSVSSLAKPVGGDVMDGIKEGQKLTSVPVNHSIKMDLKSSVRPESPSGLLVEIRAGITLKPVEKDIDHEPVTDDVVEVMAGALARVLEERCRVIHSDSDESGQDEDEDDEWND